MALTHPHPSRSRGAGLDLKHQVRERMATQAPAGVWTPPDFLDLGPRDAVDKTLQRLAAAGDIRRIDRGIYDMPQVNPLTKKPTVPDYRKVIGAIARRDHLRVLVDPLTAAYQFGWTTAVPARAVVHTERRLKPVTLGNLTIEFRVASPTRLYWAGHPAMPLIQALNWIRDMLPQDQSLIDKRIRAVLTDPDRGAAVRLDLKEGWSALPAWLQALLRPALDEAPTSPEARHA